MNTTSRHPSFLELDRYATGASRSPETRAHLSSCSACRRHIDRVSGAAASIEIPAWVRELATSSVAHSAVRSTARPRWSGATLVWSGGLASALAAAAVLLVVATGDRPGEPTVTETADRPGPVGRDRKSPQPGHSAPYTGAKGAEAVGLYIKRAGRVSLWDGSSPVMPGDSLRLKVVPGGFTRVAVFSPDPAAKRSERALIELYAGAVEPGRGHLIPAAWKVDRAVGSETLIVVLSRAPLSPGDAVRAIAGPTARPGVWVRRFVIPKQVVEN
ncbi:MAG: hypothetical protein MJE77_22840 [Proteobacteria bacterium]|nr:hypothetical protein [Pseudomonadota bacterium]